MALLKHLPPDKVVFLCDQCQGLRVPQTDDWVYAPSTSTAFIWTINILEGWKQEGSLARTFHPIDVEECPSCTRKFDREERNAENL